MDVGGATAAGLHPILVDPFDDHPDADFERITSLDELLYSPSECFAPSECQVRDRAQQTLRIDTR